MKTTKYFDSISSRPDRKLIGIEWVKFVMENPEHEVVQVDGRVRLWAKIPEMENRYLRVILLEDRETVHNAFFDRRFKP